MCHIAQNSWETCTLGKIWQGNGGRHCSQCIMGIKGDGRYTVMGLCCDHLSETRKKQMSSTITKQSRRTWRHKEHSQGIITDVYIWLRQLSVGLYFHNGIPTLCLEKLRACHVTAHVTRIAHDRMEVGGEPQRPCRQPDTTVARHPLKSTWPCGTSLAHQSVCQINLCVPPHVCLLLVPGDRAG